jgi:hypothetical protein
MNSIEIDFDVFKALTLRRATEDVTHNDVLRDLLGLKGNGAAKVMPPSVASPGEWVSKGVHFPVGTEFRATYKGKMFTGMVEDGAMLVNGERHQSPSSAASSITKNYVNGWTFWECRLPGKSSWQQMSLLRK